MDKDVREYIAACTTCARSKTSSSAPAGLLHPLPTPNRPWSHIAMDFVTGLPPSHGNTVILTIVDRFSKMARFISLPQLPTASALAEIMVHDVFRHHGIPVDIVSDRGPQFISQVWKAFCTTLGATVSLSSGYHPQSNGQAERTNQELEAALRCLAAQNQQDWSRFLVWIENWIWQCLPSNITSSVANASGLRRRPLSSAPRRTTARSPTVAGWWGPTTSLVKGYGFRPVTFLFRHPPRNWLLGTSNLMSLTNLSIPPVSVSVYPKP
uniref:Integrase catalytic domain-containing protein n=1 Tax=Oryzias sinensis TaxID=183150 RepID=A0A8C7WW16_9TELE